MTVKIGVLALQGAVSEHVKALEKSGAQAVTVKHPEELSDLDGLVLPGGESTTMRRLMDRSGLFKAVKHFAKSKPVFGTCAGLILMAKQIEGRKGPHLALLDIDVKRNAFGSQVDSFQTTLQIKDVAENFDGIFIRAPYIKSVEDNVQVLSTYEEHIVACRQGRFLACAFHPELAGDSRFHDYFVKMVENEKQ
ncbi:pyridoxal 5'-phosphate synthase glutaminase subunit PdxT [Oenococcus kitaharae]|uniref:Pyridoxal 5'-phosphate synthase subunit PdxT n=1 Tax=Oenococcus kitaharae DSM 17330 TaxID=1045004 RepID=G9WJK6_9LACO|nr:pyridoxal 5'-phosphate synthase glutaminase subunit PdxT [Oenococcus kitaharae]EHN59051.1 Pyridoxine biosynthesis glutamine amidotransferase glutaminase subunit [Oenococcus kitaharae DSM 17330]OEY83724.1 glutamine amidotransferase [Oenococcus kitaharae]OEY83896.1 glutamine amidotransferase [Oenococcus kitaharae]OEY84172.1 glutamine amidotransferase [Oenococcus kitaharae]